MGALPIREKLYEYIRIADDKKVKAIYTMVEKEIEEYHWWKDEKLVAQLDFEYENFENGTTPGYSLDEIKKSIAQAKKKKIKNV